MKKMLIIGIVSLTMFAFAGIASAANMVSEMATTDPACVAHCAQTMERGVSQCALH